MNSSEYFHKYPEIFEKHKNSSIMTMESTKLHTITITFPESIQNIIDISLVIIGISLNLSIISLVTLNSSLRVSRSYYIISLVVSNLMIMIEPFQKILRFISECKIHINLDYVFHISFYSSILTIVILGIDNYIGICERHTSMYKLFAKASNTIMRLLFIWLVSVIITAMELHLYEHFEEDGIFAVLTIMFLIFIFLSFMLIHLAIFYELWLLKSIKGQWQQNDLDNFYLSLSLGLIYFFSMVPYRIAKIIMLLNPKAKWCCSTRQIEIFYLIIKIFPITSTIVCYIASEKFRKGFKNIICSI